MIEQISPEIKNYSDQDIKFLSEVDHLSRLRNYDGSYSQKDLNEIHENLVTAVKEASVPFAVSTTHQEYRNGSFYWLDQRPEDVAFSGYKFHEHDSAIQRVDIEVEESLDVNLNLRPGIIKVFISPRMTEIDAPYEIAKKEHLADDDQIRIHSLNLDNDGNIIGKFMQSILIKDIPLSAWVAMLNDPNNIFKKSLNVVDNGSSLEIMRMHSELEIAEEDLQGGVLDIAKESLKYMDPISRQKVSDQLDLFLADQDEIQRKTEIIATRWLDFEIELAQSLDSGYASNVITEFIASLSGSWNNQFNEMIKSRTDYLGNLKIDRELSVELEKAKRNTLWVSAAVSNGNTKIIEQLGFENTYKIQQNEFLINQMVSQETISFDDINRIGNSSNNLIASMNISIGSGCGGSVMGSFLLQSIEALKNGDLAKKDWVWTLGRCIVGTCVNKGAFVRVGPCSVCESCQVRFDSLSI